MIKLQVIGNLGKDAQPTDVHGSQVINFNVAHTEKYKDRQGILQEKTVWVECAYWSDKSGIIPYLKKGTQVYVEGTPDIRTYTTNDNRQGASLTLRVLNIQLLGSKNDQNAAAPVNEYSNQKQPNVQHSEGNDPSDDLPF